MINPYGMKEQIVFQADPSIVQTVQSAREKMHSVGKQYIGRYVRIQTIDGHMLEGTLVHIDRGLLYLDVSPGPGYPRQFFYGPSILPLVLYELLVITLLYT